MASLLKILFVDKKIILLSVLAYTGIILPTYESDITRHLLELADNDNVASLREHTLVTSELIERNQRLDARTAPTNMRSKSLTDANGRRLIIEANMPLEDLLAVLREITTARELALSEFDTSSNRTSRTGTPITPWWLSIIYGLSCATVPQAEHFKSS